MVWSHARASRKVCFSLLSIFRFPFPLLSLSAPPLLPTTSNSPAPFFPPFPTTGAVFRKISTQLLHSSSPFKSIIIDCFAGVGGNTIHFALSGRWERVYGIEKDAEVLACARHNAEIYGVADQIEWIEGDCFDLLKDVVGRDGGDGSGAVLFGSPPWGGELFFILFLFFCFRFFLV